jgi:hypothetical protein
MDASRAEAVAAASSSAAEPATARARTHQQRPNVRSSSNSRSNSARGPTNSVSRCVDSLSAQRTQRAAPLKCTGLPNEHQTFDEDEVAAKLREAERTVALGNAETKRRERQLRELRAELRESTTRLEESHATMELLARRTADALAEKNRAQHVAWQLQRRLQSEECLTPQAKSRGTRKSEAASSSEQWALIKSSLSNTVVRSRCELPRKPPRIPGGQTVEGSETASVAEASTACSSPRPGSGAGSSLAGYIPGVAASSPAHRWTWQDPEPVDL